MLIFRVEKLDGPHQPIGTGAWRASLAHAHDREVSTERTADAMPMPIEEPQVSPVHIWASKGGHDHMRFGFESIRSYREAFQSEAGRAAMDNVGGSLSVYEVDREHVLIGYSQVIFDHRKATRVAVLKCTDDYYAT